MEDVGPDALRGPTHKAIVEGLSWAVDGRRVGPAAAGFQDVNDATDDAPVIDPRLTARVGRKKRFKACKLRLGKPEIVAIHDGSPFGDLESQNHRKRKTFYGSGA